MGTTALLVIDMQNDFCLPTGTLAVSGSQLLIPQIKLALEACRKHGLPIVHVIRRYRADGSDVEITRYREFQRVGGALIEGTPGAEIVSELTPLPGEHIVIKPRWSAFFRTGLDQLLKGLDVDQVVITGVQTPNCIRSSVWDANALDYEVIVLEDGTGAKSQDVHQSNLLDMRNIGVQIMSTKNFVLSLPNPPKELLKVTRPT